MKRASTHRSNGQGIVEYILITALVALAMVAAFRSFRDDIGRAYKSAGEALVQGVQDGVGSGNESQ